jgi:ATPase family associated with various cellular activities (AAA)
MTNAFDHIERTASGHFRLNFYAAVYHLVHALRRLADDGRTALEKLLQEHHFLARYLEQILPHLPDDLSWDDTVPWWRHEIAGWEKSAATDLPLAALAESGVGFDGRLVMMLAALGEEDSRFGTLYEALQAPWPARRPSLELVGRILNDGASDPDGWGICRALLASGLVEVANPEAPRAEWTIRLSQPVWRLIRGERGTDLLPGCRLVEADTSPPLNDLVADPALVARLGRVSGLVEDGRVRTLVVKGMPGSDQIAVLGAVARAMGRGLAIVQGGGKSGEEPGAAARRLLGPVCLMGRYMPIFAYDLAPGETAEVPALPGYTGPLGVALGMEGGVGGVAAEASLTLTLPPLTAEERRASWRRALDNHVGGDLDAVTDRFLLPAGHIRQAAAMAVSHAALDRRETVELRDIREACRTLNRQMLDTHAALLDGGGAWRDLVVSNPTALRLRDLELRCRQRERLLAHLGSAFAGNRNRGVRALFSGASGTGKTLAAKIIAVELGLDLYRVDLGAVVNKYIGETEKNLHLVLSRAEALDVILLLDEGDSLLGNRTEVKNANDRYANLETNYLLQRLETFQGIVFVTTNAAQHIDRAFQRRMDVVVPFVHPEANERRAIWRLHLPARHAIDDELFEEVV